MKRRTLLQGFATVVASLPFARLKAFAEPRELTPEAVATLHEIAPTVLPASLGADRLKATVDKFAEWTRNYREGVPLQHGYGHPRLRKTGPTPAPTYLAQLTAIDAAAKAKGGSFASLDATARRAIVEESIAKTDIRNLPPRPSGQHVVVDLMALYFRSSEANDDCYNALINREICRPIAVTITKPKPKHA